MFGGEGRGVSMWWGKGCVCGVREGVCGVREGVWGVGRGVSVGWGKGCVG